MTHPVLPSSVQLDSGEGGLPCLRVSTPRCVGTVYLDGATVTEWTPAGHEPVLFVSSQSRYAVGTPIRGGVPLCAPWFAKGRRKDKTAQHGFFRISRWELTGAHEVDGAVTLSFALDVSAASQTHAQTHADPPVGPGVRATYDVTFGDDLDMALTVYAGDSELDLEEALHSYLRVGDIHKVTVSGLDGCRYVDQAPGGRAVNAQSGEVRFARETDRVYAHDGTVQVEDPGLGRTITVAKEGSASTVVWNPWEGKAAALSDLADDEWLHLVCVESANALRQSVTVPAGQRHLLRQRLAVARS